MRNTKFAMTFYAEGWPKEEKLAEPTDKYTMPPSKKMIAKVTGINPGYGATCVGLLASAVTVLKESDKMPNNGGVYPPGAAFGKTNMISTMENYENGFHFEIVRAKEDSTEE